MKTLQEYAAVGMGIAFHAKNLSEKKAIISEYGERTFQELNENSNRYANFLLEKGLSPGDGVAIVCKNRPEFLEALFGPLRVGLRITPINWHLTPEEICYIVENCEAKVVVCDAIFPDFIEEINKQLPEVIVMSADGEHPLAIPFNETIAEYDESDISDPIAGRSMLYTSGTTGNPKGVVYSHRSMVLHTFGVMMADTIGINEKDVLMPVVPMFHANSWGIAHAGVATGATLVMPGADLSPTALATLIEDEKVTVAAGVPTIWMGVLPELKGRDTSALRSIPCGGSAVPKSLSEGYREQTGLPILQAWGMTETSPIAAVCNIKSSLSDLNEDAKADLRTTVGLAVPGVDFRVVEPETGEELPWDSESRGELQVRGPWVAKTYYNDERANDSFTEDGWLKTGDVATVDSNGYISLVDRTKDLIKSGGEWVSSVELENEIMAHPEVVEAAVIGITSTKWGERPMACVVRSEDSQISSEDIISWLDDRVVKWWIPERVEFIDEVPKTSVGKFSKKTLRDQFSDVIVD